MNVNGPAGAVGESSPGRAAQWNGLRNENGVGPAGGKGANKKKELVWARDAKKCNEEKSQKKEEEKAE